MKRRRYQDLVAPIELVVDGTRVIGTVHSRGPRRIEVDVCGLVMTMTAPLFWKRAANFEGDQGEEVGRAIVRLLHERYMWLRNDRDRLNRAWDDIQRQVQDLEAVDRDAPCRLLEHRRQLRAQLRAGDLDQRAYQRALGDLRPWRKGFAARRAAIISRFLLLVPFCHEVTVEKVLAIIKEPAALTTGVSEDGENLQAGS